MLAMGFRACFCVLVCLGVPLRDQFFRKYTLFHFSWCLVLGLLVSGFVLLGIYKRKLGPNVCQRFQFMFLCNYSFVQGLRLGIRFRNYTLAVFLVVGFRFGGFWFSFIWGLQKETPPIFLPWVSVHVFVYLFVQGVRLEISSRKYE